MANIKDRIEKLKPYFISFNVIAGEEAAYVLLRLPDKWSIPDQSALKENFKVEIAVRQEGVYFMTEINNGTDYIFDAADYVVTFNKNVEKRKHLLNEKIKELTEIFAKESLENLKKLTFIIPNEGKATKSNSKKDKVRERIIKIDKTSGAKKITSKDIEPVVTAKLVTDEEKEKGRKTEAVLTNNDNDLMSLAKGLTGE